MDNICKTVHKKNTDMGNMEYYSNCKCCRILDFIERFKTFSVTGFPK